jgi:transcription-repair coupling factor (superfamily II helicase)
VGLVKDSSSEEVVIKIKYLDGTINLSVKKMFKVSFVSRETEKGSLIGSLNKKGAWNRKKLLIKKNIDIYVDNLVSMYTKNKSVVRPAYLPGGELEESFIDSFKFVDTKDQGVVWGEIKKDLEGSCPMSRLLCGDVGFGKTEIAVRAAFRVVVNGGRVVVLCPTSVLVGQHFGVFLDRLSNFGVVVSSLVGGARTSTKTALINDWVDKKIDVLIATSAALYDDVFIKFASLFIIDEEHRFGVKQKEVLVNKFVNKDVLFMSATPIPRTLHLGLSGVHNISTLSTPPVSRKPINTIVSYFSEELIKQGALIKWKYYEHQTNLNVEYEEWGLPT